MARPGIFKLCALVVAVSALAAACATPTIPDVVAIARPTETPSPAPVVATGLPTPTPAPVDGEPGVDARTIRIGVITDPSTGAGGADQDGPSAADAVRAWAAKVNAEGGLAGRRVEVERINTQLFNHAGAIDQACNSDFFALVGSAALYDADGLDQLESTACGLPDFPAKTYSHERLTSRVTTVSNPVNANTFSTGWAFTHAVNEPELVAAAATMFLDLDPLRIKASRMVEAASAAGFTFLLQKRLDVETDFADAAAAFVDSEAQTLVWPNDGGRLLELLNVLRSRRVVPPLIDCGQGCYSSDWVAQAGAAGEGVYTWLATLPVEDADRNVELATYLLFLDALADGPGTATAAGINAWAAGLLFEAAVNQAVGSGTPGYDPDRLSRQAVIDAADTIVEWDAHGLHGLSNPALGTPSSCYVSLRLSDGIWRRASPGRRGTLVCDDSFLVQLQATADLEVPPTPSPLPEPTPAVPGPDGAAAEQ